MNTNWEEIETCLQESFNDIKIDYKPCSTLTVTVLCGRDIRVGFFHDLVDVPDPKVYVSCDKAVGRKKFRTKVAWDQYNPKWNETFTFVLPESFEQLPITSNLLLIKIEAYEDDDYLADTLLGKEEINVTLLRPNQVKPMTIDFGEHGEIDVLLCRRWRTAPDSRLSFGLGRGERKFRLQRKPKTVVALQKLFGNDSFPQDAVEAPNISLAVTGGGYRAVAATAGAIEAFAESGLLDTFMYIFGLSGSCWYLSSAYVHNSLNDYDSIVKHHNFLRKQMEPHLAKKLVSYDFCKRYWKHRKFKRDNRQTTNFVDLYGMAVGETFLGLEKIEARFSDLCNYVKDGDVPFPIFTCSHVRDDKTLWEFCVDFEMSPYEISVPAYAINIPCDMFNSMWMNGIMQQKLPEPMLHYVMGASGSAFALMWNKVKFGNELHQDFLRYVDDLKTDANETQKCESSDMSSSEDDLLEPSPAERKKKTKTRKLVEKEECFTELQNLHQEQGSCAKGIEEKEEYGKGGILKRSHRTALVHNLSLGQEYEISYKLNTQAVPRTYNNITQPLISAKKKLISLCDSGLAYNLPALSVLRPQRDVNIMIVIHCDNYIDEKTIKYRLIAVVRKQADEHGVKFPKVDMKKIAEEPFKELYIFEDEDDLDCPLVLWFTLANKTFRSQKELNLRPDFQDPTITDPCLKADFNDFSVFPESSPCGTFRLSFSPLTFDRVRELMRFNILSNVEVVKKRIADRIEMMRKSKSYKL